MTPEQRALRGALVAAVARVRTVIATHRDPSAAPTPGEWSPREVVLHLAAVDEEVWWPRLDSLLAGDEPRWAWVEPGLWVGPGAATAAGAVKAFALRRAMTVAKVDALDALGEEGWRRRGRHATFGLLDLAGLARVLLAHDEEHLAALGA